MLLFFTSSVTGHGVSSSILLFIFFFTELRAVNMMKTSWVDLACCQYNANTLRGFSLWRFRKVSLEWSNYWLLHVIKHFSAMIGLLLFPCSFPANSSRFRRTSKYAFRQLVCFHFREFGLSSVTKLYFNVVYNFKLLSLTSFYLNSILYWILSCSTFECFKILIQRWAEQLVQMYIKWAEKQGHKWRIIEKFPSKNGGIKSAILEFESNFVYGYLMGERGVHRMIKASPDGSLASEVRIELLLA